MSELSGVEPLSEQAPEPECIQVESNPDLDAFLSEGESNDGTNHGTSSAGSEKPEKITDKQAAEMVVSGLSGLLGAASAWRQKEIVLPEAAAKLSVCLFSPVVKKYGSNLDFVGGITGKWDAEVKAALGVGVVAFVVAPQLAGDEKEVNDSGDQREHS